MNYTNKLQSTNPPAETWLSVAIDSLRGILDPSYKPPQATIEEARFSMQSNDEMALPNVPGIVSAPFDLPSNSHFQ